MATVNRFKYNGFCVGGPRKGTWLLSHGDPVYPLARMVPVSVFDNDQRLPYVEKGRGSYEWDSGIWWWRGWD